MTHQGTSVSIEKLPARRRGWLRWLTALLALVVVVCGVGVYLHVHSGYPGSARRNVNSNDPRVNATIERKAHQLVAALAAGDTQKLMDLSGQSRAEIQPFLAAYGHRSNTLTDVRLSSVGALSALATIGVPCSSETSQSVEVGFHWERTSWFTSTWQAYLTPPGTDQEPAGCSAP